MIHLGFLTKRCLTNNKDSIETLKWVTCHHYQCFHRSSSVLFRTLVVDNTSCNNDREENKSKNIVTSDVFQYQATTSLRNINTNRWPTSFVGGVGRNNYYFRFKKNVAPYYDNASLLEKCVYPAAIGVNGIISSTNGNAFNGYSSCLCFFTTTNNDNDNDSRNKNNSNSVKNSSDSRAEGNVDNTKQQSSYRDLADHYGDQGRGGALSFGVLLRKYGPVFIGTYLSLYAATLGGLYLGVESGSLDPAAMLAYITGNHEEVRSSAEVVAELLEKYKITQPLAETAKEKPHIANIAVAWIVAKFTEPLRIGTAAVIVPRVARYFQTGTNQAVEEDRNS